MLAARTQTQRCFCSNPRGHQTTNIGDHGNSGQSRACVRNSSSVGTELMCSCFDEQSLAFDARATRKAMGSH
eukprot:13103081-Alexandrium_andersonii.AAC.1